ncbi:protease modulator HflC [Marinimicrobium alkaliphilum]|uniref:protease modulator HflC n=1 Tax=Marinimicrobium alkaliphilum TaxID=2202654 RepID=UPI000DB974FC|nr:protease modulator HflC [Marinimicrobium alkaliphilum]
MSSKGTLGLIVLGLALIVGSSSVFIINQFERAVVLRFGALYNVDVEPGLHFKIPFADQVRKFDARVLTADARPESFFTIENKRLIVDSYAKWRIVDVRTYYEATGGDESVADSRLATRIADGLRNEFGRRTLHEVVSGERDALMDDLTESLDVLARDLLGVEVIDIRVKRIDLPTDVSESVFERMAADREKEASEHRAIGREQAEVIRADADRQRAVLEANAYRDAERIRGDGDARAAAIFADVFQGDPEFYAFVRSLSAYRNTFSSKNDMMVIDPSSDFLRFFKGSQGER